jgi:(2Fe-2S) ferredoxin
MAKPEKHIFICTQNRPPGHPRGSCVERNGAPVMDEFVQQIHGRNLFTRFIVTPTGCIGPCGYGPSVLVYPEGVMYSRVTAEDVNEIIDRHLLGGEVVERLLMPPDLWG